MFVNKCCPAQGPPLQDIRLRHQDYVQEGKIAQQRHSIDKKSKKTELGGKPTTPQLDSRPKKITAEPKPKPKDLKDYGSQLQVRRQMMQDKFELLSIGHL